MPPSPSTALVVLWSVSKIFGMPGLRAGFLVAEPNPDAPAMSWVQATAAPPVSAAQRAAELARQAEEESTPAVREGYHAALTLLPSKGYGAVVDAIRTLEGDALVKGSSFELDKVLRAELVVARRVTGKDPKGLLLLNRIHSELLVEYDRAKLYIQAAHARRMIEGLAAMLADTGPAAKPQAAEVMADMVLGVGPGGRDSPTIRAGSPRGK